MLKITYTNGDIQNVKVTGDFFSMTLAPKDGKIGKVTPIEKAETFGLDLADGRGLELSQVEVFYPGSKEPKIKLFKPVDEREVEEKAEPTPAYLRELKALKKEWRYKKHQQVWKWNF